MSDILERWPILDLYELLVQRSARHQQTKSGLVKAIKVRNGKRFLKCPNPAHPDKHPSCRFNENTDHFKCFSLGCGGNGRKVDLIRLALGMPETASNAEAIARLKELDPSWQTIQNTLTPQDPPDPRFRDGEWIRLDHERLVDTYRYDDLDGHLRYEVLRFEGLDPETKKPAKRFAQRRPLPPGQWVRDAERFVYVNHKGVPILIPDGSNRPVSLPAVRADGTARAPRNSWYYNLDGIERIPWQLRGLRRDCGRHRIILVPEGENKAKILRQLGFASTANSEGTSFHYPLSWHPYFEGAAAILFPSDCDEAGRIAARMRARAMQGAAPVVAAVDLWPDRNDKYDIANFVQHDLHGKPLAVRARAVRDLLTVTLEREGLREQLVA